MSARPSVRCVFVITALVLLSDLGQSVIAATNDSKSSDQSALMNIWNYQIERKVKTSIKYKEQDLAVWEEVEVSGNTTANRRYYVTPPAILIPSTAICQHIAITNAYEVVYDIQLWEKDLPSAVAASLKELSLAIREDQIHPLPFYQARVIWNNPEEQLQQLKLSAAWINNLKQQQVYNFRVAAENNASCQLLAETIRKTPNQFVESIQLQFTVSAAKIDSKAVDVRSEHIAGSQLAASLKSMPNAAGADRYLKSDDYNRMLWQISNQVLASEVTSGDYVDADDELSLKAVIAQMFDTQKQNTAQFDDKMWNSVFWDPLNERPDQITNELNKYIKFNQTDHRAYLSKSDQASSNWKVNAALNKGFNFTAGIESGHQSQSGLGTDDISHLLESYDIESQVQGDKFVPKQLDLTRLNVNDLSRKDLMTTKRVRVRQVEIAGVLQVGIGNFSSTAAEEENRYLRQQLTDVQNDMRQMKDMIKALQQAVQG